MKKWLKGNRGFIAFLLCFGFFRLAIADWNPVPSGSMRPTLQEGDVVLVNRLAYDFKLPLTDTVLFALGTPQRGDVVTFNSPKDGVRLIKRLVALPGDTVEMRNEVLYINGQPSAYDGLELLQDRVDREHTMAALRAVEHTQEGAHAVQFLPQVSARRNFGPVTVPEGNYFFLGDNRDNSADSRYIGFVPRNLLIGRAHHIVVSADMLGNWLPRIERFGQRL
ncbi:signal peptidase I [Rhodoferax sp. GW822-FHT02A01]|uniref:signal peptidase I n=1 Tax=Rhodoferax sp. GW822-FHT02A01 TaxID=3141537 RepID=UPI00315CB0E2